MTSWELYKQVYLNQLKRVTWRDVILIVLLLVLFSNGVHKLTERVESIGLDDYVWQGGYWLIGSLAGLSVFMSGYRTEEIRFLWSLGQSSGFLTQYSALKKLPILLLMTWMVAGQLIWDTGHTEAWLWALDMITGFLYAELLGYAFLSRRSRSRIAGLIMLVVNAAFVLLPQDPITRVSCWIVLSIFMLWLVYRIAPASWFRVLRTQSSNSNLRGGRWFSHHPLLKKELQFLISLARLFPFVVCLVSIELFGYFFMDDSPGTILPISTALLIWIANDIWAVSSIGLEEKGITLYKTTVYAWRKMLRTKWLLLWGLSSGIAVIHQIVWELILKHPFKDMIFPLLWNILLAAAMVSFCLWTGYKFAAPERSGYYRITFLGSWVIVFIMILLVCLRQMNMILFTMAAVIIQVRFFFFYRQIPKE